MRKDLRIVSFSLVNDELEFIDHAVRYMQTWESENLDGFEILHNRPANRPDP